MVVFMPAVLINYIDSTVDLQNTDFISYQDDIYVHEKLQDFAVSQ